MRALFLLLLCANLALYAWWRYGAPADAADSAPLSRQIEPEKLKVIAPADLPPLPAPKKPASIASSCLEWGSFVLGDVPRAQQALEPLALGARVAQRRTQEVAGWWVFIPSQESRQGAIRKAQELRNLGIDEYFIVQEDTEHRWAVSLGVFRSEEAAQARLAALRAQGVRSALVGQRETVVPRVWLQVKNVDAPLQARLKEIARLVEGSELKDCP
jgi:SPOR domain